jgi:hypothetical protein
LSKLKPMADNEKNGAIQDIDHEMVPSTVSQTPQQTIELEAEEITTEATVKKEIAKFRVSDAAIEQYKKEFSGLKVADIQDKEGYKKVKAAWQIVRGKRLEVEKKHKLIKADYVVIGRAIDGEKNRLVGLLEPLENELGGELDRIDGLVEAEKLREENERQKKLQGRVAELLESGMTFNGSYYCIGESVSMDVVTLKNFSDADYTTFLDRVKAENKKLIDAKAEQERLEQEERERLQREKTEQEAERLRLAKEKEDLENEKAEMKKARTDLRVAVLQNAGFKMRSDLQSLVFTTLDAGHIFINFSDFQDLDGTAWDAKFSEIKTQITNLRQLQAEHDEKEQAEKKAAEERARRDGERRNQLAEIGMNESQGKFFMQTKALVVQIFMKPKLF